MKGLCIAIALVLLFVWLIKGHWKDMESEDTYDPHFPPKT